MHSTEVKDIDALVAKERELMDSIHGGSFNTAHEKWAVGYEELLEAKQDFDRLYGRFMESFADVMSGASLEEAMRECRLSASHAVLELLQVCAVCSKPVGARERPGLYAR